MNRYSKPVLALALSAAFLFEAGPDYVSSGIFLVSSAEARVGRPATPGSVAGVARRSTRRVIRRGAYVAALPSGCTLTTVDGYSVYACGGAYYQPSGSGYVIVTFY